MQQKKCGRCKQVKDISEFKKESSCYCRKCLNEYYKKHRTTGKGIDKKYNLYGLRRGWKLCRKL